AVTRVEVGVAGPVGLAADPEVEGVASGQAGAGIEAHVLPVAPPAEVVVGGAVLHHHDHDVLDVGELGGRSAEEQRRGPGEVHQVGVGGAADGSAGAGDGGGLDEGATRQGHGG